MHIKSCANFKNKLILLMLVIMCSGFAHNASAGEWTCRSSFCEYKGKITNLYINMTTKLILVYVDGILNRELAAEHSVSMNMDRRNLAIPADPESLEWTKLTMSILQQAYAQNKDVTIFVSGNIGGYPKFDRVWVN